VSLTSSLFIYLQCIDSGDIDYLQMVWQPQQQQYASTATAVQEDSQVVTHSLL